uniref:Inositol polyphosphate-related phosphatase domain-containing protein n=1 Tax=Chromera velia CCMP2878 TaxID=1169474 RepID=A0A0G4IAE0_9ALVE|eukprot:Cvel_12514.t1-p1 / transcript=Cvel_12514.t1 / gene=Cvel_12514 / organism=Chromera_velia_CCMP2878 / gene_product=Polyphosphatidylinositol phosphatase INP52, putative / transcript_product=Polyphosphatidylinositol phosphatase INP52, putative / location=Cvel_scaffold821:32754-41078(+) / protein_length=1176 / sequence_SO=supercontig / SO=protein_coding / is_pseudo=false
MATPEDLQEEEKEHTPGDRNASPRKSDVRKVVQFLAKHDSEKSSGTSGGDMREERDDDTMSVASYSESELDEVDTCVIQHVPRKSVMRVDTYKERESHLVVRVVSEVPDAGTDSTQRWLKSMGQSTPQVHQRRRRKGKQGRSRRRHTMNVHASVRRNMKEAAGWAEFSTLDGSGAGDRDKEGEGGETTGGFSTKPMDPRAGRSKSHYVPSGVSADLHEDRAAESDGGLGGDDEDGDDDVDSSEESSSCSESESSSGGEEGGEGGEIHQQAQGGAEGDSVLSGREVAGSCPERAEMMKARSEYTGEKKMLEGKKNHASPAADVRGGAQRESPIEEKRKMMPRQKSLIAFRDHLQKKFAKWDAQLEQVKTLEGEGVEEEDDDEEVEGKDDDGANDVSCEGTPQENTKNATKSTISWKRRPTAIRTPTASSDSCDDTAAEASAAAKSQIPPGSTQTTQDPTTGLSSTSPPPGPQTPPTQLEPSVGLPPPTLPPIHSMASPPGTTQQPESASVSPRGPPVSPRGQPAGAPPAHDIRCPRFAPSRRQGAHGIVGLTTAGQDSRDAKENEQKERGFSRSTFVCLACDAEKKAAAQRVEVVLPAEFSMPKPREVKLRYTQDRWHDWEGDNASAGGSLSASAAAGGASSRPSVSQPPSQNGGGGTPRGPRLRVLVCTWNMHGKNPPKDCRKLIRPDLSHDICVFGTAECERSIRSSLIFQSKALWEKTIAEHLGPKYFMLISHTLQAIHLAIFVKSSLAFEIKDVKSAHVATGIANVIGNKGGIGVSFRVRDSNFCFVTCHLQPHQGLSALQKRNEMLSRILTELAPPLQGGGRSPTPVHPGPGLLGTLCPERDRLFVLGDINYRLTCSRERALTLIAQGRHEDLLAFDQLGHFITPRLTYRTLQYEKFLALNPQHNIALPQQPHSTSQQPQEKTEGRDGSPMGGHGGMGAVSLDDYLNEMPSPSPPTLTVSPQKDKEGNLRMTDHSPGGVTVSTSDLSPKGAPPLSALSKSFKDVRSAPPPPGPLPVPTTDARRLVTASDSAVYASALAGVEGETGKGEISSLAPAAMFREMYGEFDEFPIEFPPSYKYDAGSDTYDTKKLQCPAWTDRILWRKTTNPDSIRCVSYDSVRELRTSDHRPVYAQFSVAVSEAGASGGARGSSTRDFPSVAAVEVQRRSGCCGAR